MKTEEEINDAVTNLEVTLQKILNDFEDDIEWTVSAPQLPEPQGLRAYIVEEPVPIGIRVNYLNAEIIGMVRSIINIQVGVRIIYHMDNSDMMIVDIE